MKPESPKTFKESSSICNSICGLLYFPATIEENNEVRSIAELNNVRGGLWIRISDKDVEGVWKDAENRESLSFFNWSDGQPNNWRDQDYGYMHSAGFWADANGLDGYIHLLCELS